MSLSRFAWILWICLAVGGVSPVSGQEYPNRPIRIITSAAGGGSDFAARQIAQGIAGPLGQLMIVDNRGSAVIAADTVMKAPVDGYALFVGGAAIWIGPLLQRVSYDIVRDLSPISLLHRTVSVVAVHPSVPVKTIKELIGLAKSRPAELNYSASGIGGPQHLGPELFKSLAGVNIVWVPYKGNAPAITALLSGEVQVMFTDAGLMAPHIKSGRVRALAVTSRERSALFPALPTVAASLPGYESVSMTGIWTTAKTPATVINRLNHEIVRVLNLPDVKERFLINGDEIVASTPERFAATIQSDITKMVKLIKDADIKVN